MNPVADPREALHLYVSPPSPSVADEIAVRFELEPTAAQVLAGGVGSGKTTEVLRALARVRETSPEDVVEYIDVTRHHRLDAELSGVLIALAAKQAMDRLSPAVRQASDAVGLACRALSQFADGFTEWVPFSLRWPQLSSSAEAFNLRSGLEPVTVRGVLSPPPELPAPRYASMAKHLQTLLATAPGPGRHFILAFDGLDRLPVPDFHTAVRDDLRVLKAAGIGVLIVAPSSLAFSEDRTVFDLFDRTHLRHAFDVDDPAASAFLRQVLERRAPAGSVTPEALTELVRGSGGFLRDLVAVAKAAGEAAYVAGHELVEAADAHAATVGLGNSLAFGLSDAELAIVKQVDQTRSLAVRGPTELLLIDRRVLVPQASLRWRVHPALAAVLQAAGHLDRRAS